MASFLPMVLVNWLIAGGTLSLWYKMDLCRWMRMYSGHFTKRDKSLPRGRIAPPILEGRGLAGNKGSALLVAAVEPLALLPFLAADDFSEDFPFGAILLQEVSRYGGGVE